MITYSIEICTASEDWLEAVGTKEDIDAVFKELGIEDDHFVRIQDWQDGIPISVVVLSKDELQEQQKLMEENS